MEIDQLEQVARSADEDSDTPDAYRSVQRLRESMTRDELRGKRVEMEQLEARERELAAAEVIPPVPPGAAAPAWDSDETVHDMPAVTLADDAATVEAPVEAEDAATIVGATPIIETEAPEPDEAATIASMPPVIEEAEELPTPEPEAASTVVGLPPLVEEEAEIPEPTAVIAPEPAPFVEPEPASPPPVEPEPVLAVEGEPEAAVTPVQEAMAEEPVVEPPFATEPVIESPVALESATPTVVEEPPVVPATSGRPGSMRILVAALALIGILAFGVVAATESGLVRLGGGGAGSAPPTSAVAAIPPEARVTIAVAAPSPAASSPVPSTAVPTAPPTAAPTAAPTVAATARPTSAPTAAPTLAPTEVPTEVPVEPTTAPPASTAEFATIIAPPGFSGAVVRSAPSPTASVVRNLQNGARVELIGPTAPGTTFRWYQVRTADGAVGWLASTTIGR
ncbi:MAG: Bacterial domain [Chloroflexota bacterium]|jgi:hypothetical protein|nr:Bacterial domain [Chloroflexota bacterium]